MHKLWYQNYNNILSMKKHAPQDTVTEDGSVVASRAVVGALGVKQW